MESKQIFECSECSKTFTTKRALKRHIDSTHNLKLLFTCSSCKKEFDRRDNLVRHMKFHKEKVLPCTKCNAEFQNITDLKTHMKHIHSKIHVCDICGKRFSRQDNLRRHERIAHNPTASREFNCASCKGDVGTFSTIQELMEHRRRFHSKAPQKPVQSGKGFSKQKDSRKSNAGSTVMTNKEEKIESSTANSGKMQKSRFMNKKDVDISNLDFPDDVLENENLMKNLRENSNYLIETEKITKRQAIYNIRVNSINVNNIITKLNDIFLKQTKAFKINVSFSFVLRNHLEDNYRFYYGSLNNSLFTEPHVISDREGFDKFVELLREKDILESIREQRPNSKWLFYLVTNVIIRLNYLDFTIGSRVLLPDYILNHRSIISLAKDNHNDKPYNDNLCFFRALALHNGHHTKNLELNTKVYFRHYLERSGMKERDFEGVDLGELPDLELLFHLNINVYSLDQNSRASLISRSHRRFDTTLFLNLFKNHFSFIKNVKHYCKSFECQKCSKLFISHYKLNRHARTCTSNVRYVFPGGVYKNKLSIFQELNEIGITVPIQDRFFPYFATFDFECILEKMESESVGNTAKLEWVSVHRPVSVSCCSNVPEFEEEVCFVNTNEKMLVEEFISHLNDISDATYQNLLQKFEYVFSKLDELIDGENRETRTREDDFLHDREEEDEYYKHLVEANEESADEGESENDSDSDSVSEEEEESDDDKQETDDNNKKYISRFEKIKEAFDAYLHELPVLGFNSGKYDINAIKKSFFEILNGDDESDLKFTVKKNNAYLCIKTEKLKFLDISNYLAVGCSYDQFLKAFESPIHKSYFPYEWFDHADKLNCESLPAYDCFYSELSQCNVLHREYAQFQKLLSEGYTESIVLKMMKLNAPPKSGMENYQELQNIWMERNMQTFEDFLVFYNNLDVKPFVLALDKLTEFYRSKGLDTFKDGMSVPGLASRYIFDTAGDSYFSLFNEANKDLYYAFKRGICGGPSIVFHRHQERNVSKIRGGKPCKSIVGFDANALYLWAISQPMPTGPMVRRLEVDGFKPQGKEPIAIIWLEWMMKKHDCHIRHQLNYGEKRIGPYKVDGWDSETNTIYEFNGCFYHGHSCHLNRVEYNPQLKQPMKTLLKQTQERKRHLSSMGYNVIDIWECEFRHECETDETLHEFINQFQRPLDNVQQLTLQDIVDNVISGRLFGAVECDIHVPDALKQKFSEMSPIFKNVSITLNDIGEHMREYADRQGIPDKPIRSLIGSMFGEKILLGTPLLQWYLQHGLELTRVYQIIEFKPVACFKNFADEVSDARRSGDTDPSKSILAETFKLIGNSAYGCMLKNKEKYRNIKYCDDFKTPLLVNDPFFRDLNPISDNCYEVEMAKKTIRLDLPTQIGFLILQYAKLRMLEFYYDFLDRFIDRSDYQFCYTDTDSLYAAFSSDDLESLITPNLREEYLRVKYDFFPRDDTPEHFNYDKRTPGLFKEEYRGDGIICLSSKMYYCFSDSSKDKFSCKGISKNHNKIDKARYLDVLTSGQSSSGTNTGFRVRDNQIMTYRQDRQSFTYFYPKRKVLNDGVSTTYLDI